MPIAKIKEMILDRKIAKLIKFRIEPRKFCKLIDGKVLRGTRSLHLTKSGRRYRLFLRIKRTKKGFKKC
jgi:hypothetical protein